MPTIAVHGSSIPFVEPTTIVILLGLALVAFLAIKWAQFVFGALGFLLLGAGVIGLVKFEEVQNWLKGGDLKGLAPQMQTITYGAMGLGAALLITSFLLKKVTSLRLLMYIVGLFVLGGLGYAEVQYGPTIRLLFREGVIRAGGIIESRQYQGDSKDNLKALYRALIAEHDSEGVFPLAPGWMDAIKDRITTGDMSMEEAEKKYADPALGPYQKGRYGFAMNDRASGKYAGDFSKPDEILLIFTSSKTERNAHGAPQKHLANPPRGEGNLGVTVSGNLVKINEDGSFEVLEKLGAS
ncbi:MAG: hypothetical protein WAO58_12765 [Fimbriimonadaceae bacterium]